MALATARIPHEQDRPEKKPAATGGEDREQLLPDRRRHCRHPRGLGMQRGDQFVDFMGRLGTDDQRPFAGEAAKEFALRGLELGNARQGRKLAFDAGFDAGLCPVGREVSDVAMTRPPAFAQRVHHLDRVCEAKQGRDDIDPVGHRVIPGACEKMQNPVARANAAMGHSCSGASGGMRMHARGRGDLGNGIGLSGQPQRTGRYRPGGHQLRTCEYRSRPGKASQDQRFRDGQPGCGRPLTIGATNGPVGILAVISRGMMAADSGRVKCNALNKKTNAKNEMMHV
ncbi:hypothetical protein [Rhodobacter capsulatus]|uniref:hypothetical protein n=1 Tax=Rhodobacter capsulatus TaxID=1061 RepID=UPI0040279978